MTVQQHIVKRLIAVACHMQSLHGTLFAAAFLAEHGVPIESALTALAQQKIQQKNDTSGSIAS